MVVDQNQEAICRRIVTRVDPKLQYIRPLSDGGKAILVKTKKGQFAVLKSFDYRGHVAPEARTELRVMEHLHGIPGIPKVITAYNFYAEPSEEKVAAILKEYVPGRTLDRVPSRRKIFKQIINLGEYIGARKFSLPYDLKPEQFIVDKHGKVHLIDVEEVHELNFPVNREEITEQVIGLMREVETTQIQNKMLASKRLLIQKMARRKFVPSLVARIKRPKTFL
jgi:serine/threonine protein kinase